jgi:hypothetical protein
MELLHGFQKLPGRAVAAGGHRGVEVHVDGLDHLQGLVDIPVSQIPFQAFQVSHNRITQRIVLLLIPGLVRQALGRLLEHGQPHRHMESIEQMLGVWVEIELELPHGVAAVGEEGDPLVELMAL